MFLIPYYLILFMFGIPQMLLETAIGQYFRMNIAHIFAQVSPKYQGIPIMGVLSSSCVSIYYIYIMAYCFIYLKVSWEITGQQCLFGGLPWLEGEEKDILSNTHRFYNNAVLNMSPKKDTLERFHYPLLLSAFIAWVVVYICIRKGVKTTGKVAIFTVLSPYLLLVIFLVKVMTLDGFGQGLKYLFEPDFSKLFTFEIWKDAMVQVAFQLNVGQAVMISFATFRNTKDKLVMPSRM